MPAIFISSRRLTIMVLHEEARLMQEQVHICYVLMCFCVFVTEALRDG